MIRCVAAFHSTYAVLKAEQLLEARGIKVKLIPVPRQISSNCGIAARFDGAALPLVREAIAEVIEDLEGLYREEAGDYRKVE